MPGNSAYKPGGHFYEMSYDQPFGKNSPKIDIPLNQELWELSYLHNFPRSLLHCHFPHDEAVEILDNLPWTDDDPPSEIDDFEPHSFHNVINEARLRALWIYEDEDEDYSLQPAFVPADVQQTTAAILNYNKRYWEERRLHESKQVNHFFYRSQHRLTFILPTTFLIAYDIYWIFFIFLHLISDKSPTYFALAACGLTSGMLIYRLIRVRYHNQNFKMRDISDDRFYRAEHYRAVFRIAEDYHYRHYLHSFNSTIQEIEM